ncbi:methyl-accepting chemotaxis protein, partial [Corallococcus llansteffanensis]
MTLSLAARLTAALTAVVVALTLGTVFLMGLSLRSRVEAEMVSSLARDAARWESLKEQEVRVVKELARVAAANPVFAQELSRASPGRADTGLLTDQRALLGVDLLALTAADGRLVAATREGNLSGLDKVVRQEGQVLLPGAGAPLLAAAQPLKLEGTLVGYLVVGSELGAQELGRLGAGSEQLESLLHVGPRVVAQSVHAVTAPALLASATLAASSGV